MMEQQIFDLHITALKVLENEMIRLHERLESGDGDNDTTQSQLSNLHDSLNQLNVQLTVLESQIIERNNRENPKV